MRRKVRKSVSPNPPVFPLRATSTHRARCNVGDEATERHVDFFLPPPVRPHSYHLHHVQHGGALASEEKR